MSFLPRRQLTELVKFAAVADKEARSDLSLGFIAGENDYTSNFTGALRRIINSNSRSGLTATSFVLPARPERALGSDAAIVLNYGNEIKVAVFEGKLPRFSVSGYPWDHLQKSSASSHFSDQIKRQSRWTNQFAVFEMIYCEYAFGTQPNFLENEGSSCIWHDDAERFRVKHKTSGLLWTQDDLRDLLTTNRQNLKRVIRDFGQCKKGRALAKMDVRALVTEFQLPANVLSITAPVNDVRRDTRRL
jgi:hypothetical protein